MARILNRRSFFKQASTIAGLGLISPIELIKLFESKKTFYSIPSSKIFSIEDFHKLLKEYYLPRLQKAFEAESHIFEAFPRLGMEKGRGILYNIKYPEI